MRLSAAPGLTPRPPMTRRLAVALFAAFADGHKADSEREAIRRIAESLSDDQGGHPLATLYQDVLLQRVTVPGAVAALTDPAHRQDRQPLVGKAHCLQPAQASRIGGQAVFHDRRFFGDDFVDVAQEPRIIMRDRVDFIDGEAFAEGLTDDQQPVGRLS